MGICFKKKAMCEKRSFTGRVTAQDSTVVEKLPTGRSGGGPRMLQSTKECARGGTEGKRVRGGREWGLKGVQVGPFTNAPREAENGEG